MPVSSVQKLILKAAKDGVFSEAEAMTVAAKVAQNGKVSVAERKALQGAIDRYRSMMAGDALPLLQEAKYFAGARKVSEADLAIGKQEIALKQGEALCVALGSSPTSGYAWSVASTPRAFGYPVANTYRPGAVRRIGSGGTEQLTWAPSPLSRVGDEYHVTLQYKRPWETAPARTLSLTIKIV